MDYRGYKIHTSKSGKTFYCKLNDKIQTWSNANSLTWCKKHIDDRLANESGAMEWNNRIEYGTIIF